MFKKSHRFEFTDVVESYIVLEMLRFRNMK